MHLLYLCDVIILNPQKPAVFHIAPSFFVVAKLPLYDKLHYSESQPAQVNMAIYLDISRMNQPLRAISVIKNAPEGAAMARVFPGSVYVLQLALDYWGLLE